MTEQNRVPPSALSLWTTQELKEPINAEFCGHAHGNSQVWRLRRTPDAVAIAYLKWHRSTRKFEQELNAYTGWLGSTALPTPRLIGSFQNAELIGGALLLTAEPGQLASSAELSESERRAMYERAGEVARALHSIEVVDDDPLPLSDALPRRFAHWLPRARRELQPQEIAWLEREFANADWHGLARVPCHRDYQPRNWFVTCPATAIDAAGNAGLTVIDFEHAGLDAFLVDFVKLWDGPWVDDPGLEASFFRGYGRELTPAERKQLEAIGLLHAVATIGWSVEHGDRVYLEHGLTVLRRARHAATD